MASGTFERPLPNPADERSLLGLGEIRSLTIEMTANTSKTLTFNNLPRDGLIILSAGDASKRGLYIYGATTTGNVGLTAVHAPTQSGLSITTSGRSITIANPTLSLFVCLITTQNGLPSVS